MQWKSGSPVTALLSAMHQVFVSVSQILTVQSHNWEFQYCVFAAVIYSICVQQESNRPDNRRWGFINHMQQHPHIYIQDCISLSVFLFLSSLNPSTFFLHSSVSLEFTWIHSHANIHSFFLHIHCSCFSFIHLVLCAIKQWITDKSTF